MRCVHIALFVVLPILVVIVAWIKSRAVVDMICVADVMNGEQTVCRLVCPAGQFSLPWMDSCQPLLTCHDINSPRLKIGEHLGNGAVKNVWRATWDEHEVVYNTLANPAYKEDFKHGLKMLVLLQPTVYITQLIGHCRDAYVTQYHPLGTPLNLNQLLNGHLYQYNTLRTRLGLCISYAKVIAYLHNSTIGTRVMCDSNNLHKTLNQFLLTPDLKLVANDVDALPLVNRTEERKIKCGHRELFGDFVAPEQLWPYTDRPYLDEDMPLYDEKTDIWKIPDVCEYFLGDIAEAEPVKYHLFNIHHKCKSELPSERPSASEIVEEYIRVYHEFIP